MSAAVSFLCGRKELADGFISAAARTVGRRQSIAEEQLLLRIKKPPAGRVARFAGKVCFISKTDKNNFRNSHLPAGKAVFMYYCSSSEGISSVAGASARGSSFGIFLSFAPRTTP